MPLLEEYVWRSLFLVNLQAYRQQLYYPNELHHRYFLTAFYTPPPLPMYWLKPLPCSQCLWETLYIISIYSKETGSLGENSCRQKCLDKSLQANFFNSLFGYKQPLKVIAWWGLRDSLHSNRSKNQTTSNKIRTVTHHLILKLHSPIHVKTKYQKDRLQNS